MVQVLVISLLVITTIYLLINGVFIRVLGMERMAASDAVGVDLMRVTLGEPGVFLIGVLVALAALTSRSEEHTSELQSLMRRSYAVFCLKKKTNTTRDKSSGR